MIKLVVLLAGLGGVMSMYRHQRLRDRNLYEPVMSAEDRRRWNIRFWTPYVLLIIVCLVSYAYKK